LAEKLVVVFAKTAHTCAGGQRVESGQCASCLAYIVSSDVISLLNGSPAGLRGGGSGG